MNPKNNLKEENFLPPLLSPKIRGLKGTLSVVKDLPGDKSISHRAFIFGALAQGTTVVEGANLGEDVKQTREALMKMGVSIVQKTKTTFHIKGSPTGYLCQPSSPLYLGNSGTSARLLCGVVASQNMTVTLYGDSSLNARPMSRVLTPLKAMGASFFHKKEGLPLTVTGTLNPLPIFHTLKIPSAQVKTAIIIAGLKAKGLTTIREPVGTRDHTERLLTYMDYPVLYKASEQSRLIQIPGNQILTGKTLCVPADPSAAAFIAVGALITPHSHIKLEGVCWNPFRNAIFTVLQSMGGQIHVTNNRLVCGEPVADLDVFSSELKPIQLSKDIAVCLIDEYPILSVAAAYAPGVSDFQGLSELRYKESNRLTAIAAGLQACGVQAVIQGDSLQIQGKKIILGGGSIDSQKDHRMALSFYVLGMASQNPVTIYGAETLKTSFPNFLKIIEQVKVLR